MTFMTSYSNFISILKTDVPRFYGNQFGALRNQEVDAPFSVQSQSSFELRDLSSPANKGVIFSNPNKKEIIVVDYDRYFKNLSDLSPAFAKGKKNCDYILLDERTKSIIIFNEMTSESDEGSLDKPIKEFGQSKHEKMRKQLVSTLQTLLDVPEVQAEIEKYEIKECLMTIIVCHHSVDQYIRAANLSARFSKIAMDETNGEGMEINDNNFKSRGFGLKEKFFHTQDDVYTIR